MQKAMVFIDYENFEIARQHLYKERQDYSRETGVPWLDIAKLPKEIIKHFLPDYRLVKTFLFAPEPDEFLMKETWRKKRYDFLKGLGNTDFFTVIPGRHVARPRVESQPMASADKKTYFVDEKGSDVNIAVEMITKAFHNSYDVAIVLSGDTDYIPIYCALDSMGKSVIVAGVKGQNLSKFKICTDRRIILNYDFLKTCEKPLKTDE